MDVTQVLTEEVGTTPLEEKIHEVEPDLSTDLEDSDNLSFLEEAGEYVNNGALDLSSELRNGMEKGLDGKDENDPEDHYYRGIAHMEIGLYDEAIEEFKLATQAGNLAFDSYTRLGLCYMAKEVPEEAINFFGKGLEMIGENDDGYVGLSYELGLAYEATGKMDKALEIFKKIEDKNRSFREVGEKIKTLFAEGSINDKQVKSKLSHTTNLYEPTSTGRSSWLFTLFTLSIVYVGWNVREYEILVAESGLGYALGIIGGSFMLMLLLYPLRKKIRLMQRLGGTRYWFTTHMILGILGPVLILFHANFRIGSMNSNIALMSMLLVAASGIVGRYIYTKIHYGLYGKRESLKELQRVLEKSKRGLVVVFDYAPNLRHHLQSFETAVTTPSPNILYGIIRILFIAFRVRWNYIVMLVGLRRALQVTALNEGWTDNVLKKHKKDAQRYIATYLLLVKKIVLFNFYERLFAKWHVFHLPLFIMLVITGLVHVVSVHMY